MKTRIKFLRLLFAFCLLLFAFSCKGQICGIGGIIPVNTNTVNNSFETEWDLPSGSFTLPLYSGPNYNFIVNWGDGSTSEITSYSDVDKTHTYASTGTYTISISGECGGWSINNGTVKSYLIKVTNWGNVSFTYLSGAFWGCNNLVSIPNSPITGASGITNITYFMRGCTSLTSLPVSMFSEMTALSTVTYAFSQTAITSIPSDLFEYSSFTNLSYCFRQCTSLQSIPAGLFDNVTASCNFSNCFYLCNSIGSNQIPLDLFNNCNPNNLSFFFAYNSTYTGSVPDLWNSFPSVTHTSCFLNDTNASNYSDIPSDWK